jgi:hypothetical protein
VPVLPAPDVPEPDVPEPGVELEDPEPGVEVEPAVLPELDVSGLEVDPDVPEPAVPELDVLGAVELDVPEPVVPVELVPESLERLQPAKITVSKPASNMTFDLLNAEFITAPFVKI